MIFSMTSDIYPPTYLVVQNSVAIGFMRKFSQDGLTVCEYLDGLTPIQIKPSLKFCKIKMFYLEQLSISCHSQTDHEAQRQHNVELVKMQEQSSFRKEQARQATEEQIQSQQRQTERERAEIERETIRVKAMAEAEGRAHEAKLTEDHKLRSYIS